MTNETPEVLVIVNSKSSAPRRLIPWLEESGVSPVVRNGADGLPETLEGYAGLVMLGGGLMPDEDDRAPWFPAERALAAEAIAADIPTLGICLGGQLLAHVAGGEVRAKFGTPEVGMTTVATNDAGSRDAVLSALTPAGPVVENHQDRITQLPPEAELLASSEACEIQAFRLGRHVRGLQFHPEASAENVASWDADEIEAKGMSAEALVTDARSKDADNTARSAALVRGFADEVRAHAGASAASASSL
jgi:GMP synthase-like glutamine amidotransferase